MNKYSMCDMSDDELVNCDGCNLKLCQRFTKEDLYFSGAQIT